MAFDRLIALYMLLPEQPKAMSAAQLHAKLTALDCEYAVSLRQMQRDLNRLLDCRHLRVANDDNFGHNGGRRYYKGDDAL